MVWGAPLETNEWNEKQYEQINLLLIYESFVGRNVRRAH